MLLAQYLGQPGPTCTPLHLICTQVSCSFLLGLLPAGLMHSHRNQGEMGPHAHDLRPGGPGHLQNQIRTWEEAGVDWLRSPGNISVYCWVARVDVRDF